MERKIPGTSIPLSLALGEFKSKSDGDQYHYVYRGMYNEIMCSCKGFEYAGHCWHTDKIIGRLRNDELRAQLNAKRIEKHGSVFEDMIPLREAIYQEQTRRRIEHESLSNSRRY